MRHELITWFDPAEKLPDAEILVLLDMGQENFILGYYDEDGWNNEHDILLRAPVLAWTDVPAGGGESSCPLLDVAKLVAEEERAHWDNQDQDDDYREPTWLAELERVIAEVSDAN